MCHNTNVRRNIYLTTQELDLSVNRPQMPEGQQSADNELFYMDKTMMVFGDAKKVVEDMVKAVD
ncbi:NAD(P)(+) transhydrogenase (Re/Si-specific) subunit beta [Polynucleobacter sp. IMCC 29146]|uniref:NAD(P)(+) transhydrogenase (Re/Si-specific) subunit beta n=1 Tax=Polynucleobacter sp. IMCC 29146 TaxID=2780953 RepID=UPI00351D1BDA